MLPCVLGDMSNVNTGQHLLSRMTPYFHVFLGKRNLAYIALKAAFIYLALGLSPRTVIVYFFTRIDPKIVV